MSSDNRLDDKRLEILYQHYCAMGDRNKSEVRTRYRYLLLSLALLVFNILQMLYASDADALVSGLLGRLANVDGNRTFASVDFLATVTLMLLVVRYFQIVLSVERQYPHIHYLEKQLSEQFNGEVFSFEGKGYLSNYPGLLNVSHFIFTRIVPASFVVVACWRIGIQFPLTSAPQSFAQLTIIVCSALIVLFVMLYWWFLYQLKSDDDSQEAEAPGREAE